MTEPFTLRGAAGLAVAPAPLADTTLVVIDSQLEYTTGSVPLTGVDAAVATIAGLLTAARAAGSPVVHVQHRGAPGGLFDPDGNGAFVAETAPVDGETVVGKTLPNAFAKTNLDEVLRELGASTLTVVGFMTHMCVSSTARSALDHGYDVSVLADACATRDLPGVAGAAAVDAATIHAVALSELADRFAAVGTSDQALP